MLGSQVFCTNCNHQQNALNAQSKWLVCTACQHLFSPNDPKFKLKISTFRAPQSELLKLGDEYTCEKETYILTGKIVKQEKQDKAAFWTEYCFTNAQNENLFLSEYNGHWNQIEEAKTFDFLKEKAANTFINPNKKTVFIENNDYYLYHHYQLQIEYAEGEFNFNPFEDNGNTAFEYIKRGNLRIVEEKKTGTGVEYFCYKGKYLFPNEVLAGLTRKIDMPDKVGYVGNQPFYWNWDIPFIRLMSLFTIIAMLGIAFGFFIEKQPIAKLDRIFITANAKKNDSLGINEREPLMFVPNGSNNNSGVYQKSPLVVSTPFEHTHDYGLLRVEFTCDDLQNDWAGAEIALVNTKTDETRYCVIETEYYSGFDDGAWSEGSHQNTGVIEHVPKGTYQLEIQSITQENTSPKTIVLDIYAGRGSLNLFWAFAGILIILNIILWFVEDYFIWLKGGKSSINWDGENS